MPEPTLGQEACKRPLQAVSLMEELLLAWHGQHGRDLPWRGTTDPYAILVSEVMLQQTQALINQLL